MRNEQLQEQRKEVKRMLLWQKMQIHKNSIYPPVHRHQRVVVYRSPVFILYGADHCGPQQLEDGVVFAILQQIHGVPRHWVVHRNHKVQHVLLLI